MVTFASHVEAQAGGSIEDESGVWYIPGIPGELLLTGIIRELPCFTFVKFVP